MKKKVLAALLCASITATMFTACGTTEADTAASDATEAASEEATAAATEASTEAAASDASTASSDAAAAATMAEAEALPESNIKYHFTFDEGEDEGVVAVKQTAKEDADAEDPLLAGATFKLTEDDSLSEIYADGVNGNSLYVNGNYGYKLPIDELGTDSYTVSFWVNASRLATYGPVVQMGRNIGAEGSTDPFVTWINFTQAEWGTNNAKIFPVVWDRNSETGAWPWVYAADDAIHGKGEWCLVTLVTTGETYTQEDGFDRVGTKLYLNGVLAFDASSTTDALYGGLATGIFTGDGVEGYIGINYWDTVFKGYIDDMYIFDTALTDGQVATLYEAGDATVAPTAPEGADDLGKADAAADASASK